MTEVTTPARVAVIGVGNEFRHDDGIGPRLIAELTGKVPAGVRLVVSDGEPAGLLDAWDGADLVILVDAVVSEVVGEVASEVAGEVVTEPSTPGRMHRTSLERDMLGGDAAPDPLLTPAGGAPSSHGLGIPEAVALGRALGRLPSRLIVYAVEAADVDLGPGLSAEVAATLPDLVDSVFAELPQP